MSETGTCLLLEGAKVRAELMRMHQMHLAGVIEAGPESAQGAWAMYAGRDPVALGLRSCAALAAIEHLYSFLFGEEIEGSVTGNG